ncbi:hypothetical protein [Halomonas sp. I5-271120]|uniref:hypothetical protein n=1 Tax=Halomonas sp. I5-271120 TaxID=3061632 RepID=UPI0027150FA8|nr:hypothetical protein [Halomonas sp. I5-271120]
MRIERFKVLEDPTNGERVTTLRKMDSRHKMAKSAIHALGMLPFLHVAQSLYATSPAMSLAAVVLGLVAVVMVASLLVGMLMPNGILWKSGDAIGLVGVGSRNIERMAAEALQAYNNANNITTHEVVTFNVEPKHWNEVARVASVSKERLRELAAR